MPQPRNPNSAPSNEEIVKEGWREELEGSNVEKLFKDAIYEARIRIQAARHMFQNEDGTSEEPNEHWVKNHGSVEAAQKEINGMVEEFKKQQSMILASLLNVETHNVRELVERFKDIKYLSQVGGAYNALMFKVLENISDTVESTEELREIFSNFGTKLFFHVSGWEYFTKRAEQRLSKKK